MGGANVTPVEPVYITDTYSGGFHFIWTIKTDDNIGANYINKKKKRDGGVVNFIDGSTGFSLGKFEPQPEYKCVKCCGQTLPFPKQVPCTITITMQGSLWKVEYNGQIVAQVNPIGMGQVAQVSYPNDWRVEGYGGLAQKVQAVGEQLSMAGNTVQSFQQLPCVPQSQMCQYQQQQYGQQAVPQSPQNQQITMNGYSRQQEPMQQMQNGQQQQHPVMAMNQQQPAQQPEAQPQAQQGYQLPQQGGSVEGPVIYCAQ